MPVYILHASSPIGDLTNSHGQAQHYVGYSRSPETMEWRIKAHRSGRTGEDGGSNLTKAFVEAGIHFVVARVWPGKGRDWEKRVKAQKNTPRLCPICSEGALERMKE